MNWDAVLAISQIASGIAVVISVLYLAFQIRFARLAAADVLSLVRPGPSVYEKTSLRWRTMPSCARTG